MGDYTRFKFTASLRIDTPSEVLQTLRALVDGTTEALLSVPQHALFRTERWDMLVRGGPSYFEHPEAPEMHTVDDSIRLSFHCALKNYGREIEAFCDWIGPYVADAAGTVIGEIETEDQKYDGSKPVLLVAQDGSIAELLAPESPGEGRWDVKPGDLGTLKREWTRR